MPAPGARWIVRRYPVAMKRWQHGLVGRSGNGRRERRRGAAPRGRGEPAGYGAAKLTAQRRAHRNPLRNRAPGQISTFHPNARYALDKVQRTVQHRRSTAHRRHAVKRTDLSARIVARSSSSRADAPTVVDVVVSAIANAGFGSPPSGTDRLVTGALPALATQTLSPPRKRWRSVPPESSARPSINENESRGREASERARLIRRTDPTEPPRHRIATMPTSGLARIDIASSHDVGGQDEQSRHRRSVSGAIMYLVLGRTTDLTDAMNPERGQFPRQRYFRLHSGHAETVAHLLKAGSPLQSQVAARTRYPATRVRPLVPPSVNQLLVSFHLMD